VQFEVQYTYQCVNVAIDHGQKTVSKLDLCPDVMEKTLKITTSGNDALITQTFIMPYDLQNPDKLYVYQLSDFQVLRIAGETSIDLLIIPE
jgi:hypothetical protein